MFERMSPEQEQKQEQQNQMKLKMLEQACQSGNKEACFQLRDITFGNVPMPMPQQRGMVMQKADGGSLLAPDMEMEMDDDQFAALAEILGPEKYEELEEAMEMHPIVREVAEMATMTSDGEVDGMGGPKDDLVPARLSEGEFVFSAEAVQALGLDYLEELHEKGKQMAASL